MKKFIITISIVLVMTLACSQIAVFAMSNNDQTDQESAISSSEDYILFEHNEEDVNAKKEMEKQYESNFIQLSENEISLRQNLIYDILDDESIDDVIRFNLLEEIKVYPFISSSETASLASESTNVQMGTPSIYYDSMLKRWIISAAGYWKSYSYLSGDMNIPWHIHAFGTYVGETWNVGGTEAVGISLTNTSGSSYGLLRTAGYGRLSTPGLSNNVINSNSSTADDRYGALFEMQDYCYVTSVTLFGTLFSYKYIGYNFNTIVEYNSNFANWNGTAKMHYMHTWSQTSIDSLGVSNSGVSVSWSSSYNRWPTYGLGTLY